MDSFLGLVTHINTTSRLAPLLLHRIPFPNRSKIGDHMSNVLHVENCNRLIRCYSGTSSSFPIDAGLDIQTTFRRICHTSHSELARLPYVSSTLEPPNQNRLAYETEIKIKKLVLHVDDDDAILDIVGKSLQIRGSEVVSINDPSKARLAIAKWSPRVVILDINMPEIDGLTLLQEIKQRDASIQVVILTGMSSMATVQKATRFGAQECVFKPMKDLREVGNAVERCFSNFEGSWNA